MIMSVSHQSPKVTRRNSAALKNVVVRRNSLNAGVNLNALVRVFFLDGSSKVLQMFEQSTAADVLIALKFNLDLCDISTHALFRVFGKTIRRIELEEIVSEVLYDPTDSGQEVRLLFRSWIVYKYGAFDCEVFQYGHRLKQANTALWLSFMEASFMVNTEKFFLTEDESLVLGCLKMQAESGDFNPSIHTLDNLKNRVIGRFPNPIKSKMKALCSSTVNGNGVGNDLASRVQLLYARLAGKTKVDAQLDFLASLRVLCPYFGATFFEVHCQYDENPLEQDSSPAIISVVAAIGPLAIILMTQTEQPILMRHPFKRIIKWISYPEKHIFTYWVIKPNFSYFDLAEHQEEALDNFEPKKFCDCVYLVTSQVKELEHLVKSYVDAIANQAPFLPGARGDLLSPSGHSVFSIASTEHSKQLLQGEQEEQEKAPKPKTSRFSLFFNALRISETTASNSAGSGLSEGHGDEIYGDDTAGVSKSVFQNVYKRFGKGKTKEDEDEDEDEESNVSIPPAIQFAASMTELKKLADEQNFSDNEDEISVDSEHSRLSEPESSPIEKEEKLPANNDNKSTLKVLKRASNIIFGSSPKHEGKKVS